MNAQTFKGPFRSQSFAMALAMACFTLTTSCDRLSTAQVSRFPPMEDLEIRWRTPYGGGGGGGSQLVAGDAGRQGIAPQFFPARQGAGTVRRVIETPSSETVTFDFANASVLEAAELVLGTTLNRNYAVHPDVQGIVSFRTNSPLSRDGVLRVFDIVISSVDATLIEREEVIEIVPRALANRLGPSVSRPGDNRAGYRVEIVPLTHISASEMNNVLEPLAGGDNIVAVDDRLNLIVLEGTARELDPLLDTVETFDQDFLADNAFALIPLSNTTAAAAVTEMEAVFGAGGGNVPVRFVAISGMNAVTVIGNNDAQVREMADWLRRIDRPPNTGDGTQVYAYVAQNTRASNLAEALGAVLDTGSTVVGAQPGETAGEDGLVAVSSPIRNSGGIRVVAEEQRNAVLVTAPRDEWRNIEAVLHRLDVPPLQVLLEVTIAEVVLTDDLEQGLQWFFQNGDSQARLSNAANGAVGPNFPGFSYVFQTADVNVALSALAEITEVRFISAPSLMVVNNETAELQVGDEVPVLVSSTVSNETLATTSTIQYRDTGVILKVTPRINASGLVTTEIVQEVSSVGARSATGGLDSPTFQQRRFQTTVTVPDRQVIALGGLIQDQRTFTNSGVPGAKDIPVIGNLFSTTRSNRGRTELLVIVTPTVVRDGASALAASQELREKILGNR